MKAKVLTLENLNLTVPLLVPEGQQYLSLIDWNGVYSILEMKCIKHDWIFQVYYLSLTKGNTCRRCRQAARQEAKDSPPVPVMQIGRRRGRPRKTSE